MNILKSNISGLFHLVIFAVELKKHHLGLFNIKLYLMKVITGLDQVYTK